MPDNFPAKEQQVRKRVLWPVGITLTVFLLLFLAIFQLYLQRDLSRKLDDHLDFVATLYRDLLAERSATLQILIKQVQRNPTLTQAMLAQDFTTLFTVAKPLFDEFLHDQKITHFYFHAPDSTNLLRVHKYDIFGDQISRITMQQATSSQQTASGAELGPLGTFTLRVVVPWFFKNKLIGYVEFGQEVEPLLTQIAEQTGSQLALLVKKTFLHKDLWEKGQAMLGRSINWQALPEHVITATTEGQLLSDASRFISAGYLAGQQVIQLSLHGQHYRGRYLPLADAGGLDVGEMMILQNIDDTMNDHRASISLVTLFCLLLGGSLFSTAYSILGRAEQALTKARQKLVDEINNTSQANIQLELKVEEKQRAEQALKDANDNLELRVLERTTQLARQKVLLEQNLVEARQTRDRISGIMRSVDDVLFVVDEQDRILLMNQSACRLLRVTLEEVIGTAVSNAIGLETLRDQVLETLKTREGGIQFDFEINNSELGSSLTMHVQSSALIDPQGRYEGMIFLAHDVTRYHSMDRLKSEFISVAAHELRTPLAAILGFSELLHDNNISSETDRQDYVQIIHNKAESLTRLLDEMLDISRIESGRPLELHPEPKQVRELFLPTLQQYQKRVKDRQFDVDLADANLLLQADTDKMAQVMENLLSNAVKFSEKGSLIRLAGKITAKGYQLTITDQGIGMSPQQATHAFEKFYRGDSTNKAIKGTGLGLTITKHIIEEHDGEIWIETCAEQGTKVHFVLPLA